MLITGILLAAGCSERFGGNKLLHHLSDGTPIAVACARQLRQHVDHAVAVLRPEQYRLADLLRAEGVHLIPYASTGMGESLATAIKASCGAAGWVVTLGDMPFIQSSTIANVVNGLRQGHALVAPTYQGLRGHPVGFQRCFYHELSQLQGDTGAQSLLRKYAATMTLQPCEDAGIIRDVDTYQDLHPLFNSTQTAQLAAYHVD
jgi:molybdenum cofactor cytidylyltransferase